jgi:hypothetical protein
MSTTASAARRQLDGARSISVAYLVPARNCCVVTCASLSAHCILGHHYGIPAAALAQAAIGQN